MKAEHPSDLNLLLRLAKEARPFGLEIAGILLLGLLATPLALLLPLPLKIAVDHVVGSDPLPALLSSLLPASVSGSKAALLLFCAGGQVLVVLLVQFQEAGDYVLQTYAGERLTVSLRERLFQHVQQLSFVFHDTRGISDSIYRIQYDAQSIQQIAVNAVVPVITSTITFVSMVYVTARIHVGLAVVALSVSPFLFLLARAYNSRMRDRYRRVKRMESRTLNIVQEVLSVYRVVKAFGREESERQRFTRQSVDTVRARVQLTVAEGVLGLLVNLAIAVGTAAVLVIGVRAVQGGTLSLGELLVVMAYLSMLYGPLKLISKQTARLQSALAGAQRVFELLDAEPEVAERPGARPVRRVRGAFVLNDVSFSYGKDRTVLDSISLTVEPGSRVGIVGPTGAGKTTLISLLMRFYDPTSGCISLDGIDLRDYRLADLRNQFGLVLQEPILFAATVAENIAYGKPNASRQEIEKAATAARAHGFIERLPRGYDTLVGERGMHLSGGERQRVALARAFIRDAPILILDEPTSSVDKTTEVEILEAMVLLARGRTTFMITHRHSALVGCDLRIVLEGGRLSEWAGPTPLA